MFVFLSTSHTCAILHIFTNISVLIIFLFINIIVIILIDLIVLIIALILGYWRVTLISLQCVQCNDIKYVTFISLSGCTSIQWRPDAVSVSNDPLDIKGRLNVSIEEETN